MVEFYKLIGRVVMCLLSAAPFSVHAANSLPLSGPISIICFCHTNILHCNLLLLSPSSFPSAWQYLYYYMFSTCLPLINTHGVGLTSTDIYSSVQSMPPPLQALFHLLPTLTTDHNAVWKRHSWWRRLPDLICQPVHHHHKQVEVQVIPPWLWTHLSSLPHVSAPSHCHSSPGFLMQFFSWFSIISTLSGILYTYPLTLSKKNHHSMKPYWSAPLLSTWIQQLCLTSKVQHISLIPLVLENQHQNTSATLIWH